MATLLDLANLNSQMSKVLYQIASLNILGDKLSTLPSLYAKMDELQAEFKKTLDEYDRQVGVANVNQ